MSQSIARTKAAADPMAKALKEENRTAASAAAAEFGEASHDVTHAYYGDWLPVGGLQGADVQAGGVQRRSQAATGGHGHEGTAAAQSTEVEKPNWPVIVAFVGALVLVVAGAGLTRPRGQAGVSRGRYPRPAKHNPLPWQGWWML